MRLRKAAVLFAIIPLAAFSAAAQTAPAAPAAATTVSAELATELGEFERKAVRLAEAIPADKYGWRPGEGVRSIGDVINHIAMTNYTFPNIMGAKPPAGVDVPGIGKQTDKEQMIATLKQSFDHARKVLSGFTAEELERVVRPNWSVRRTAMFMVRHGSEHTGQLIAYARQVGIVPPWTEEAQRRQQQPAKQQ